MSDQANIEFLNHTFGAGETRRLGSGSFVGILDATSTLTIKFFAGNTEIGSCEFAEAGYEFELPRRLVNGQSAPAFDHIEITSAGAQTVKLVKANAKVKFNQISGSVSLTSYVPPPTTTKLTTATTTGAGSAYALADTYTRKKVLIQADPLNTGTVRLTDGTNNYHYLYAGDSVEIEAGGIIRVRFSAAASDKAHFMETYNA